MEKHVNILGILLIAFGIMGLIGASVAMVIFVGGGLAGGITSGEPLVLIVAGSVGMIITTVIFICSIPEIIAGIGLIKFKPWSRVLGLILAALSLIEFPFGTALGIYGLWVLAHNETASLFESEKR